MNGVLCARRAGVPVGAGRANKGKQFYAAFFHFIPSMRLQSAVKGTEVSCICSRVGIRKTQPNKGLKLMIKGQTRVATSSRNVVL